MIQVGIIGGSGYTGIELIRLLSMHPKVKIAVVTSRRHKGRRINEIHPHLSPFINIEYEDIEVGEIADRSDIVFTAVPHGTAMNYVPELREKGTRVIDLSADYRLGREKYEKIYGKHSDERMEKRGAVYGLTELHPEVAGANLVANPGCYPTGALLAVAPLVKEGWVEQIVFDAKSGITGGGIEPSERSHFPNLAENIIPYQITKHRHVAEIRKELEAAKVKKIKISFTPHVIPCIRGILTTAHVFPAKKITISPDEVADIYTRFYEGKKFIRRVRISKGEMPSLSSIRGSNFCDIGFDVEENGNGDGENETGRIVVISAIDNLVKGGAGQAIQNMNVMFGLDESIGLFYPGLCP
jgi:N-acetyl-gamma-glutamyl-phosphate reductase